MTMPEQMQAMCAFMNGTEVHGHRKVATLPVRQLMIIVQGEVLRLV